MSRTRPKRLWGRGKRCVEAFCSGCRIFNAKAKRRRGRKGFVSCCSFVAWMQRSGIRDFFVAALLLTIRNKVNKTNSLKNTVEVDSSFRVTARQACVSEALQAFVSHAVMCQQRFAYAGLLLRFKQRPRIPLRCIQATNCVDTAAWFLAVTRTA